MSKIFKKFNHKTFKTLQNILKYIKNYIFTGVNPIATFGSEAKEPIKSPKVTPMRKTPIFIRTKMKNLEGSESLNPQIQYTITENKVGAIKKNGVSIVVLPIKYAPTPYKWLEYSFKNRVLSAGKVKTSPAIDTKNMLMHIKKRPPVLSVISVARK